MSGINSALNGLLVAQTRLGASANNVANVRSSAAGGDMLRQAYSPIQVQSTSLSPMNGAMPAVLPSDFVDIQSQFSALNNGKPLNPVPAQDGGQPTRSLRFRANIDARTQAPQGAGAFVDLSNIEGNEQLSPNQLIAFGGAGQLQPTNFAPASAGDVLTITTGSGAAVEAELGGVVGSDGTTAVNFSAQGGANIASAIEAFFTGGAAPTGANAQITLTSTSGESVVLSYSNNPDVGAGEFNSMQSMAEAINAAQGFRARVAPAAGGEQLLISPANANDGLSFANGGAINFVSALGLSNSAAGNGSRFASLNELESVVSAANGIGAQSSGNGLRLFADSPTDSIIFSDSSGSDRMVSAFGLQNNDGSYAYDAGYNPLDASKSMASGNVTGQFTRGFTIVDALGEQHAVTMSTITLDNGQVAVEIYGQAPTALQGTVAGQPNLLAYGTVQFNGQGAVESMSGNLRGPLEVRFNNGAEASTIALSLDELSYYSADNTLYALDQDGRAAGTTLPSGAGVDNGGRLIPNVDLAQEAIMQIVAARSYQANLKSIEADKEATKSLLDIFQ